jgi:riboflavin kinase/FMN adenylyltransferase
VESPFKNILVEKMRIIRGVTELKIEKIVATLGKFDGLHLGHQLIINQVIRRAKEIEGQSLVFTFESHPLSVVFPQSSPLQLISLHQKVAFLEEYGVDILMLVEFTRHFSELPPTEFFEKIMVKKIKCREIFVGEDFVFGRDKRGDIQLLEQLSERFGVRLNSVKKFRHLGREVSSSWIREAIAEGDLKLAAQLLGRPYAILGKVVPGEGRGRKLGFPTTNLHLHNLVLPPAGVYLARVLYQKKQFSALVNIGFRPTFGEGRFQVEVFIFDFQQEIYHQYLTVFLLEKLREEKKFKNVEDLTAQIKEDVKIAREKFKGWEN